MARIRTSRMLLALTALILWSSVLAGCALFRSAGEDDPGDLSRSPQADTLADTLTATDSLLDSARVDSTADSLIVAGRDTSDSLADPAGGRPPALSNDSLRRVTPRDTIPTGSGATGGRQRVNVRADSLSKLTREEVRIQELLGNVFVRQDSTRLRSQNAIRFLERDEFLFTGRVVIFERGDTLRADTVRYDRQAKIGRAFGNVHLSDGDVDLYSTRAVYYTDEKRSVFPDSVMLVDDDQTLTARSGSYLSDTQQADFYGDVRVRTSDSYMEADTVTYLRRDERTKARGDVFIDRSPGASVRRPPPDDESRFGRSEAMEDGESTAGPTEDGPTEDGPTEEAAREEPDRAEEDDQTLLFGNRVDNDEKAKTSLVVGRALLIQIRRDTAGTPTDTLMVQSHRLLASRSDTLNRMIAIDTVRIWQPDLAAVGDSVVYDRYSVSDDSTSEASQAVSEDSVATARETDEQNDGPTFPTNTDITRPAARDTTSRAVEAPLESPRTDPDSPADGPETDGADLLEGKSSPKQVESEDGDAKDSVEPTEREGAPEAAARIGEGAPVEGRAQKEEKDPMLEETRLFQHPMAWFDGSQVSGDTLRVVVRDRSIDTVFVRSNAFAAQRDTSIDRIQQLSGRQMTAIFRRDSIQQIVAFPNARAIRFLKDKDGKPNGGARTSADRIILRFQNGDVRRVSVLGGTETTYYKQPIVPTPFELEGFVWTPNARPRRASFLRQQRVERRLEVPPDDAPIVQVPESDRFPGSTPDASPDARSDATGTVSRAEPSPDEASPPSPDSPPAETTTRSDDQNDGQSEE